ncbi:MULTISPECIES: hypothetical protein [Actinoalloteichus]|uniref:DUF7937 domain-containing protein n=1 Tax=Actinoalloteichus fjordicus TaxID=1612552 RepID=A0AAC9LA09_9PSEU|nr:MULTISPECIES: hypothetical protein [Actinoalloteichus]APU13711.1 hypothetical protein UA74_08225 [Actinoalloteichus fjordicus]APU19657.1 hypothetical protein UA75_08205 [Actinoalloteichus sp. GBA129-24]
MPYPRIPVSDRVRDGVALVLILVSLALPWDGHGLAADRIDVVLTSILALLCLTVPYILRSGALSGRADLLRAWLLRASFVLPYVAVVITTLVLDIVMGETPETLASVEGLVLGVDTAGGFGSGLGIGLAGVLLAAAPRVAELPRVPRGLDEAWRIASVGVATLTVLCLLLSTVLGLIDVASGVPTTALTGLASLLLTMIVFTVPPFVGLVMGDLGWRRIVLWLGAAVTAVMVFAPAVESIYRPLSGLVFWPAAAALAAAPGVVRTMNQSPRNVQRVGAVVRALELIAVTSVAGFIYGLIMFLNVATQRGAQVMTLILAVALVVGSLTAHAVLRRDPRRGRRTALIAATVFLLFGLVDLVVWSTVLGEPATDPMSFAVSFALPSVVIASLVPTWSLRWRLGTLPAAGPPVAPHEQVTPAAEGPAAPQTGPIQVFGRPLTGSRPAGAQAPRPPYLIGADDSSPQGVPAELVRHVDVASRPASAVSSPTGGPQSVSGADQALGPTTGPSEASQDAPVRAEQAEDEPSPVVLSRVAHAQPESPRVESPIPAAEVPPADSGSPGGDAGPGTASADPG